MLLFFVSLRRPGRKVMEQFDLLLTPYGYSHSYDPNLNAGIGNVFAAAAYRYGHTLVQVSTTRGLDFSNNFDRADFVLLPSSPETAIIPIYRGTK